jgi:hypothetical protein
VNKSQQEVALNDPRIRGHVKSTRETGRLSAAWPGCFPHQPMSSPRCAGSVSHSSYGAYLQAVQLGAKEHFLLDQICSTTVQAGHNSRLCLAQLYFLIFYDFAHDSPMK